MGVSIFSLLITCTIKLKLREKKALHWRDKAASSTRVGYGHGNLSVKMSCFNCRKNRYLKNIRFVKTLILQILKHPSYKINSA